MLLIRLIGFLLGYVSFSARYGFPERFINLCKINRIPLRNLRCIGGVVTAQTDLKSYKHIRPIAKKSGMTVRIEKKHGLPFLLKKHRKRFGLLVGAVFCILSVAFLSTRIWNIGVTGNVRVPEEEILSVLESVGVREGASIAGIGVSATEAAALRKLPDVSWLNINFSGCTATVEIRETVEKPLTAENSAPYNLVAAHDGQIVILRLFNGTAETYVGAAVLKGDLLISAIEENKDMTVNFRKAEGYVVAQTVRHAEYTLGRSFSALHKTGENKGLVLRFLFFEIPLGIIPQNGFSEKSSLCIDGTALPVGITRICLNSYSEAAHTLSESDAKLLALLRFTDGRLDEFRGKQVKNARIDISAEKGQIKISGEFDCIENIGAEAPLEIEVSPE